METLDQFKARKEREIQEQQAEDSGIMAHVRDIKKLREARGLSQPAYARMLGISVRTLSRWENGRTLPSKLALLRIIGTLDLSLPAP